MKNKVPLQDQCWLFAFITIPFVACIAGIIHAWGYGVDLISLSLCAVFYLISTLGITIGFHRCFTHQSFAVKKPWLEKALAIAGSMAAEGPLFTWVGWHKDHHAETDKESDPHSPYRYGHGAWNMMKGFWHAHTGWLFTTPTPDDYELKKLRSNPILAQIDRQFRLWLIVGLLLPPAIGMLLRWSVEYVHLDFLWGGLIRLFLVHHVTWCVNSVCHIWGSRDFKTGDKSTNNWIIGILAHGEGWHNNHHAFQYSAKHGLLKRQFDLSWIIICLFERCGLVENVRVPSEDRIKEKLMR